MDGSDEMVYSSKTQKVLFQYYSKALLSTKGIIGVMALYTAITVTSIYYASTELRIEFKQSMFLNEDAYIKDFLDKTEAHFPRASTLGIYTDNAETDYTSTRF